MSIFGLGMQEILLIVFVLLLFFGKDKLPELARSIGRSVRELKDGVTQAIPAEVTEMVTKEDKKA